ncbi:hypothetical protein AUJ17_04065 [Candidatus Micrarchaeota archaeon CG1_02_47_40]|nr:MAG: hypothetical protein AUJ17_04065 [Candidatus Micrarchaeota archaeon CG1_02_47_40]QBM01411.1 50S ribosomal protein L10e [uncultured archaeon]
MGLRPARTCRNVNKVSWTRFSKRNPKKSYIKAMPHLGLNVYKMGKESDKYEMEYQLVAVAPVQLRDNAIEAARQAANKYMEKIALEQYMFRVMVFPHQVLRENKMISGAGADRLQKGMRMAFGRTTDRAARLSARQTLFITRAGRDKEAMVIEAYRRAQCKMSGKFRLIKKELISAPVAAA